MLKLIWKALGSSAVYRAFTDIVGSDPFRRRLARDFVRAKKNDRVLDIGCGTAEWVELLPETEYVGLDFNEDYINAARSRYGDRGRFDLAAVGPDLINRYRDFDIALAMGVLHHLDDGEAKDLLRLAAGSLREGGRFVSLDGVLVKEQRPMARWMVLQDRGRFVRPAEAYEALARSCFGKVEMHVLHGQLRIPYSHLIMVCSEPKA